MTSTRKMLDGACLAGIPTGIVGSETALRTAKLLARYSSMGYLSGVPTNL